MKERIGDALFWALSAIGVVLAGFVFWVGINVEDSILETISRCALLFFPFFCIGWLIRYVFTGRTDVTLTPTRPHS